MSAQSEYNQLLLEWDDMVRELGSAVNAQASASTKWARFQAIERTKVRAEWKREGVKFTIPEVEDYVLSQDGAEVLLTDKELTEAKVKHIRARIAIMEKRVDGKRSEISTERENNRHWSSSPTQQTPPGQRPPEPRPGWSPGFGS